MPGHIDARLTCHFKRALFFLNQWAHDAHLCAILLHHYKQRQHDQTRGERGAHHCAPERKAEGVMKERNGVL